MDGITVRKYEEQLGPRVAGLVSRLKEKRYKAPLVKRQYIDKGGGKRRPLGVPTLEDKLVQMAARRVLEEIYEKDFLECNNGYRPGRGARQTKLKLQDRLFLGGWWRLTSKGSSNTSTTDAWLPIYSRDL